MRAEAETRRSSRSPYRTSIRGGSGIYESWAIPGRGRLRISWPRIQASRIASATGLAFACASLSMSEILSTWSRRAFVAVIFRQTARSSRSKRAQKHSIAVLRISRPTSFVLSGTRISWQSLLPPCPPSVVMSESSRMRVTWQTAYRFSSQRAGGPAMPSPGLARPRSGSRR